MNARLSSVNEAIATDPVEERNEQLYIEYEIHQMNHYLFSIQYFTAFETVLSDKGINMIIGSEIEGTLLMNLPALLGTNADTDNWRDFIVLFEEAREDAGAKEITKEYLHSDNVSFVFNICIYYDF